MRQKQSKKYNQELAQELVDRYERYREILKDLTLMSDSVYAGCTEKSEMYRGGAADYSEIKTSYRSLTRDYRQIIRISQGRSAILDCVAVDREHNLYNVEIQQKREGASPEAGQISQRITGYESSGGGGSVSRSFQPVMSYLLRKQMRWGLDC